MIGPKEDLGGVVDLLYRLGTVHLEEVRRTGIEGDPVRRMEVKRGEELSQLLVRIGGILQALPAIPIPEGEGKARIAELRAERDDALAGKAKQVIGSLESVTRDLAAKKSDHEFTIANLGRYARIIERIRPLEEQLPVLQGFEVTVILIQKEFAEAIDVIRDTLGEITRNQYEILAADVDESTIAAVTVFSRRFSDQVHSFIYSQNVNEVRLPPEYMGKPFNEILGLIDGRKAEAAKGIGETDRALADIAGSWYRELRALKEVLGDRVEEASVYGSFGQTEYTFIILGWVPARALDKTVRAVSDAFGNRVVVNALGLSREEEADAPVFYDNPWFVKPFEFLMGLVASPRYWEIDPAPILAIFFPFFFGLMVGDIAYGLIILGIALAVKYRMPRLTWARPLADILIISSFPSIFFGFLFGEFFGNLGEMLGWIHPLTILGITWNRVEALIPMLVLSISIGVVHLFLGLGLGIINAVREGSRKHVCDKCGMMAVVGGIICILGGVAGVFPGYFPLVGSALVIVGLPLIVYGSGVFGAFEIISMVGNILSYARLMAIGMASVILALVANTLGGTMEVALVGVLIAALLHLMNIALAMFSPFLHSLRLHIVEFNPKFFRGGGRPFRPFRKEEPG
ncbi:MAG TPA: V-type ATPase 116kDa subunit family protein [Methanomicrobiales archaeon]|nr:V-type ATPase 116kDa subunit family protein [Methanomicrobiales archaeon]